LINPITREIYNACHILFGFEVDVSTHFLSSLHTEKLKTAFKKKALETHPDRARLLNKDAAKLNERFKEVNEAYDRLGLLLSPGANHIKGSADTEANAGKGYSFRSQKTKGFSNHYYKGNIPQWPLLLGRFLYYSGRISWGTLIEAITWQRRQRPSLGQMALQTGLLSQAGIKRIIHGRKVGERFGECAVRMGLLNAFQLKNLLKQQSRLQRPIGTYFLVKNILIQAELNNVLKQQRSHNFQFASK